MLLSLLFYNHHFSKLSSIISPIFSAMYSTSCFVIGPCPLIMNPVLFFRVKWSQAL